MKTRKNLAITLQEYRLIWSVITAVHSSVDGCSARSCLFFNTIGAFLLEEVFGVAARPVMGMAFICVDEPTASVLAYAEIDDETGECRGTEQGFHCWVETENHVIDFTAPRYREEMQMLGKELPIPRKMFQRRKSTMSSSTEEISNAGDFFVSGNLDLTAHFLGKGMSSLAVGDLAKVCAAWIRKPPKPTPSVFYMQDDLGKKIEMKLPNIQLVGAW